MDTDIAAGVTSGMDTVLVLTGSTTRDMIDKYPFLPKYVKKSVADIEPSEFYN